MAELPKVDLESKDLVAERIEQMKALFPEIVTEGDGSIDFEKLQLILGNEIELSDERYSFIWPGKSDAIRLSQTPTTATLRPAPEESLSWEETKNLYIEGDNLEVLKLLQRGYHGSVRLIYIDPPYNTGHDFVYHDTFEDSIANYREQTGTGGQSNAETSGRYHSAWCSMMYPRLRLARELLAEDGAIFISIDDNELRNLRAICDEVFGEDNFIADVIWKHTQQSKNDELHFSRQYNHTLCYAKLKSSLPNFQFDRTEQDNVNYSNPDNDPKGPWRSGDVRSPNPRPTLRFEIIAPDGTRIQPPANGWRWSAESVKEKIETGEIKFKPDNSGIIRKIYLCDQKGRTPENLWNGDRFGSTRGAAAEIKALFDGVQVFDTPKPKELICRMMELFQMEDGIVLDFFAGSSSTGHAVLAYNAERNASVNFILVQIPEPCAENTLAAKAGYSTICEIGKERLRRAVKVIEAGAANGETGSLFDDNTDDEHDNGFRVLKLDASGIAKPEDGQLLIDRIKPDRTDLDIIFEMMLKWGLELTYPIEEDEIEGYPIYSIAYDELICCMREGLNTDVLEAIAARNPRRVFLLDSVIDDTTKLNALQIFKRIEERTQQKIDLRTV